MSISEVGSLISQTSHNCQFFAAEVALIHRRATIVRMRDPSLTPDLKRACLKLMALGELNPLLTCFDQEEGNRLLDWLDVSGLALYFLNECESRHLTDHLPADLVMELRRRTERNRQRVDAQLAELRVVVDTLSEAQISFAVRKGFALTPEFCPDPHLRHQVDLDLVVPAPYLQPAVESLQQIGYRVHSAIDREIALTAPAIGGPPQNGDIYSLRERRVELHPFVYELIEKNPSCVTDLHETGTQIHRIGDLSFPVLNRRSAVAGQINHIVAHLGNFVRLSWLWELQYFITNNPDDDAFWAEVIDEIRIEEKHERGLAVVLALLEHLFDTPLPNPLISVRRTLSNVLTEWIQGACADHLLGGRPDAPASVYMYIPLNDFKTNLMLIKAAITRRLRSPNHFANHPAYQGLGSDLRHAKLLLSWHLFRNKR